MKRKIIALCLIVAMLGVAVISGTMAYFTDTAEAVNVMTIGSVKIELVEQKRDGDRMVDLDPTTGYQMVPAVYDTIAWADATASANDKVFSADMKNVYDKFVSVKNTGRSDAYVRLFFAFEDSGSVSDKLHISTTDDFESVVDPATGKSLHTVIDGVEYEVMSYTYPEAIKAGETSEYSLKQFFFNKGTTQEDVAAAGLDYTILIMAQAIQASGFSDATTALNEGFGVPNAETADTTDGDTLNVEAWLSALTIPTVVESAAELKAAIANGGSIVLAADIDDWDADATVTVPAGKAVTLDLNGKAITAEADGTGNREIFLVKGDMTVKNGTIDLTATVNQGWNAMATVFDVTAGGVLNMEGVTLKVSGTDMTFGVHLNNWGEVTLNMNDCTIETNYVAVRVFNSGHDMNNVTITNSTLKGNYGVWVHNYTAADFGNDQAKADAAAARLNFDVFNGTNDFATATAAARYGFTNSIKLDANGQAINP